MSKLLNIRCDNCGAEYRISSRGEMNCRFCGSKVYLNDQDFKDFLKTRDEMLRKDKFKNDAIMSDGDILGFYRSSNFRYNFDFGTNVLTYDFTAIYTTSNKDIYVGLDKVAFAFNNESDYRKYLDNRSLTFPSADIKKLEKFLPKVVYNGKTTDNKFVVILDKDENVYPLEMFTDGLKSTSTAWIISRLENLGCLLEFNGLDMDNLTTEDLFINPKTHDLYLLGNWENVVKRPNATRYLQGLRDSIRSIAITDYAPGLYVDFLTGMPNKSAYDDFAAWDYVINKGFGGHNFVKFDYL